MEPESLTLTKAGRFALRSFSFSPARVIRGVLHDAFIPCRDFFITVEGKMEDYKVAELVDLLGDANEQEAGIILEMLEEVVTA